MSNINLKSSTIEKGIETAKEFLEKLVVPPIEETGLLLKDAVTYFRFKNQINMINKAKKYCIKNNITPKRISFKVLTPILDFSGLEDDDILFDKWAILLSNMVDSEKNIENNVFPHILSQISRREFEEIENAVNKTLSNRKFLKLAIIENENIIRSEKDGMLKKIEKLDFNIKNENTTKTDKIKFKLEKNKLLKQIKDVNRKLDYLNSEINEPPYILQTSLEDFEISNLVRLGVVRSISKHMAYVGNSYLTYNSISESVDLDEIDIEIENDYDDFIITKLGELFIDVCTEKNNKIIN